MNEYLFDVKLRASLRITANNHEVADRQLRELLDCATANFGIDANGDPIIGEVSLDTGCADALAVLGQGGAILVEINGEPV